MLALSSAASTALRPSSLQGAIGRRVSAVIQSCSFASPSPTKYALAKLHDWMTDETRLPIVACGDEARKAVDAALEATGLG